MALRLTWVYLIAFLNLKWTRAEQGGSCSIESGIIKAQNYSSLEALQTRCLDSIRANTSFWHYKFNGLVILDSAIDYLPADAFHGLRFRKLLIADCELSRFASRFLGKSGDDVTQVIIRQSKGGQCPRFEREFFKQIRSWSKLKLLELCSTHSEVIPSRALRHLGSLQRLEFYGHGRASFTIEQGAFSGLSSLRLLLFHRVYLNHISNGSFVFSSPFVSLMFNQCPTEPIRQFETNTILIAKESSVKVYFNSDTSIDVNSIDRFKAFLALSQKTRLYINNVQCRSITLLEHFWIHRLVEEGRIQLKCNDLQHGLPVVDLEQFEYSTIPPDQNQVVEYKPSWNTMDMDQIYTVLKTNGFGANYEQIHPNLREDMIKSFKIQMKTIRPEMFKVKSKSKLLRILDELPILYLKTTNRTLESTRSYSNQVIDLAQDRPVSLEGIEFVGLVKIENFCLTINQIIFKPESKDNPPKDVELNSNIVSINMINKASFDREHNLSVTIKFGNRFERQASDVVRCVYWDYDIIGWSTSGCWFDSQLSNITTTVCSCSHLTNFAALLDVSGREDNDQIKSILTCSFCSLSVLCFAISIVISFKMASQEKFTLVNDQFRWKSNKYIINLNIAFCLLVTNFLAVAGMDRKEIRVVCLSISVTLVFFLLASFSFMFLQGYHLLRSTLNPLLNDYRFRRYFLIGYGVPTAIIATSVVIVWYTDGVFYDLFIGDFFCWISNKRNPLYIMIIVIPVTVSIALNLAFYLVIIRNICRRNRFLAKLNKGSTGSIRTLQSQTSREASRQASSLILLVFNLGLTWSTYLLYITEYTNYFAYFFIVLNGSQGFFFLVNQILTLGSKKCFRVSLSISSITLARNSPKRGTKMTF